MGIGGRTTDTIAAIATPPGTGGIGIIRISGDNALPILKRIFVPKLPFDTYDSHRLYYGTLINRDGRILDEILAVYMQEPATYTREDVVELHCHGSYLLLQTVLQQIFEFGARPADPGEFTKRAFLAGRIDLTQAEAVIDLLQARTEKGAHLAVKQLQGRLSVELEPVRAALISILARLEVAIDFPEDDVELVDRKGMLLEVEKSILKPIDKLISLASQAKIYREGISVVIVGQPNVGKSSLLNALLREERALVTDLPGTTRDTIEELIAIQGIPVRLIDTAGIRAHTDVVEELGIERALAKMRQADLVLYMLDGTKQYEQRDAELYELIQEIPHVILLNKMDSAAEEQLIALGQRFAPQQCIPISAKNSLGIDVLQEAMYRIVLGDTTHKDAAECAPNTRHLSVLEQVREGAFRMQEALQSDASYDLLAVEAQASLDCLSDIVGITTPDDVLDIIFSQFCIGK
ncbi:tRNA uridine-5-carboxymethylaminomethyl(34) synthesis GTPase MnmE [Desulfogranum japonicum]|uniref:tRNA uridine-5-carboxymethylaminomethyl(34) synthesis GTPase MnmE n=1 Tax=Desulfogranum japonicum TaxID=231447 RepID=UPI0003FD06EA|nr:tRNA uridine-5-carboxymethylaminomethyl(34) synthesis GTPase MnmE [Desulfogranum japonicum]